MYLVNNQRRVVSPHWMTIDPYYRFVKHSNPFVCSNLGDQELATQPRARIHLLCSRCEKTYFWEPDYEDHCGKQRYTWSGLRALARKSGWSADDSSWEQLVCHQCNGKQRSRMIEVGFE